MAYPSDSYTTRRKLSDWLKYESDTNHCRSGGDITASGAALDLQTGTLLTGGTATPYDDASPAATTGILITDVQIADGETLPVGWLERGPATVNSNELGLPADPTRRAARISELEALGIKVVAGIDG